MDYRKLNNYLGWGVFAIATAFPIVESLIPYPSITINITGFFISITSTIKHYTIRKLKKLGDLYVRHWAREYVKISKIKNIYGYNRVYLMEKIK